MLVSLHWLDRNHERPLQLAWRLAFPEATQAGPWGPRRNSRGTCRNSRKTRRFFTPGEMRPFSAAASRGKSHLHSWTAKGSLTPLRQLKKFPDIPRLHLRGTPRVPLQFKRSAFSPFSNLVGSSGVNTAHQKYSGVSLYFSDFPGGPLVKNLPAKQETSLISGPRRFHMHWNK